MKTRIILLALICAGALCFAKVPKKMYVAVENAELKSGVSYFSESVQKLKYGQSVNTIEENGDYVYVSDPVTSRQGWISVNALTKRKIASSNFSASADELALAGKGFSAEVEGEYKKSGKANYEAVDRMEKAGVVSNSELLEFIADGELNGGR